MKLPQLFVLSTFLVSISCSVWKTTETEKTVQEIKHPSSVFVILLVYKDTAGDQTKFSVLQKKISFAAYKKQKFSEEPYQLCFSSGAELTLEVRHPLYISAEMADAEGNLVRKDTTINSAKVMLQFPDSSKKTVDVFEKLPGKSLKKIGSFDL